MTQEGKFTIFCLGCGGEREGRKEQQYLFGALRWVNVCKACGKAHVAPHPGYDHRRAAADLAKRA